MLHLLGLIVVIVRTLRRVSMVVSGWVAIFISIGMGEGVGVVHVLLIRSGAGGEVVLGNTFDVGRRFIEL